MTNGVFPSGIGFVSETPARLAFSGVPAVGPIFFGKIVGRFGSGAAALDASADDWVGVGDLTVEGARALHRACRDGLASAEKEMERLRKWGARPLVPSDADYPEPLKTLSDAPILLFVKGGFRPVDSFAVALVGTRKPTAYGSTAAEKLARELTSAGVTVVSGLARGIDTVVHATAVKKGGRTIGVLGSGFDHFYPPENRSLADKMADQGAVVTEFPLGTMPDRYNFPRRNRIISGLSLAVVVVEADEKSGALITARLAAEQGRDVFAVPGSIFSKSSAGPHRLLRQGARLVERAEDILEEILVFRDLLKAAGAARATAVPAANKKTAGLSPTEKQVVSRLSLEAVGMDELALCSGFPVSVLTATLLGLELKGLVRTLPGPRYVLSEEGLSLNEGSREA